LAQLEIGHSYVTNNCSRSRAQYIDHLRAIGIDAHAESIWTSAHATIHYLSAQLPNVKRLFVHGTSGLKDDFRLAGFEIVDDDPEAVIVGFDTALTYDGLAQTAYWISRGLPYIATHPDRVCPTDQPTCCRIARPSVHYSKPQPVDAASGAGKPNRMMMGRRVCAAQCSPQELPWWAIRLYTTLGWRAMPAQLPC